MAPNCAKLRRSRQFRQSLSWSLSTLSLTAAILAGQRPSMAHPYQKGPPSMPGPVTTLCPQTVPGATGATCTSGSCGGGCNGACPTDGVQTSVTAPAITGRPIFLVFGTSVDLKNDLNISAPGLSWTLNHSYQGLDDGSNYSLGSKVLCNAADTFLYGSDDGLTLIVNAASSRSFVIQGSGPTYTSPKDTYLILYDDTANKEFVLTDQTSNL